MAAASIEAAEDSVVFSPMVFPPASFAGAVVSAIKMFVGWAFFPEDRRVVDF